MVSALVGNQTIMVANQTSKVANQTSAVGNQTNNVNNYLILNPKLFPTNTFESVLVEIYLRLISILSRYRNDR
jgi:hypothetical protein